MNCLTACLPGVAWSLPDAKRRTAPAVVSFHTNHELRTLQGEIFVWRRIDEPLDQAERRLGDARPDTTDECELPDRGVDRLLMHDLLHLEQNFLTFGPIEFGRLPREQLVELGIIAIGIGTVLDHERFETGRQVAKGTAGTLDDVAELLVAKSCEERCPLERTQPAANADRAQIVQHRFAQVRIG